MANDLTTTSSSAPWMAPYLQSLWQGAFNVANRPFEQYQGPRVAGLSDIQTGALGGIQGAMYGNPTTWSGMGLLGDIIGTQGNPYMQQAVDTIKSDAAHAFDNQIGQLNSQFSNPNSFGAARHQLGAEQLTQDMGRGLGQALGNLQFGQYNTGLDRAINATGAANALTQSQFGQMLQGLQAGSIPQQLQQRLYDTNYGDFQNWWNYPMQQTQFLQGTLGLGSGYGTTTQTQPGPNAASQVLGGGLAALGALNSSGAFGNNGWMSNWWNSGSTPSSALSYGGSPWGGFASDPWYG